MKTVNESALANKIFDTLQEVPIMDCVGVLSKVLILLGMSGIDTPEGELTPRQVISSVMDEKARHGETIYTALAQQGLLMVTWRDNEEVHRGLPGL